MYDSVLVPTDGSPGSDRAAEEAIELAKCFDATIHALYVVDTTAIPSTADGGMVTDVMRRSGRTAAQRIVDMATAAGVDAADPVVRSGVVHRQIVDYADEHDVGLIVMGTHGRSGLDRFLLGSVTEKVIRASQVPVLTVHTAPEVQAADAESETEVS